MLSPRVLSTSAIVVLAMVMVFAPVAVVDAASGHGLHCEDVWTGPSSNNDLMKCMTNTGRISKTAPNYVLPALSILFLVISLLVFPIIFCCCVCCQCCCYCCKDVPKERRAESRGSRLNIWVLIFILMAISISLLVVMITGSADLVKGVDGIFTNLNVNVVDYLSNLTVGLENRVRDPATGNMTTPFTNSTFSDMRSQINSIKNTTESFHDTVTNFAGLISKVGYGVAVFPLFLFLFTVLFACCNCRKCCPSCCTCIYYLIGIIFALIAFILLLLGSVFGDVCAEIDLHHSRSPGLFQWYAVPACENIINFTSSKASITDMEASFAKKFCEAASELCSPGFAWDNSDATKTKQVFACNMTNATAATDCPSFAAAEVIFANSYTKVGITPTAPCPTNCSMDACTTDCTDSTQKTKMNDAVSLLRQASRLFSGLGLVLPLMDCNSLLDRVLMLFGSCPYIRDGLVKIGVAFFMTLIGIVFAWIIMFRGQKVWFSQQEYEEGELAEAELKVPNENNADEPQPQKAF
jgi:hypothetical protein